MGEGGGAGRREGLGGLGAWRVGGGEGRRGGMGRAARHDCAGAREGTRHREEASGGRLRRGGKAAGGVHSSSSSILPAVAFSG